MISNLKSLDEIIQARKIIVTCGTGGVGKTTLSAALGLRAAELGKKVLVITVDPAKRLATSLGLSALGNEPLDLTDKVRDADGNPISGTFSAVMPNTQQVFEEFVTAISPSQDLAQKVLGNPIFQIFSTEFSGANEYMALERLHTFDKLNEYDLIVLDTPPSRNVLAFLDAPELLLKFFDEKLIQWLVVPANKIVGEAMRKALHLVEKLTGHGFLTHLMEFAQAIFEVQHKFSTNLMRIRDLLKSEQVGFLLVTTPRFDNMKELDQFISRLGERQYIFDGIAINRSVSHLENDNQSEIVTALKSLEEAAISKITSRLSAKIITRLPELARDVHSIEDLSYVAQAFAK